MGVSRGYSGAFFKRGDAPGVEGTGGGGARGLDAGVGEELYERGKVLLCAFRGAGEGYYYRTVADAGDRAGHHCDCMYC